MVQVVVLERLNRSCGDLFKKLSSASGWMSFIIGPGQITNIEGLNKELDVGSEVAVTWSFKGIEHSACYRIIEWNPGHSLAFSQKRGVFSKWTQRVTLTPDKVGSLIEIQVDYELPFSLLGALINDIWVQDAVQLAIRSWAIGLRSKQSPMVGEATQSITP